MSMSKKDFEDIAQDLWIERKYIATCENGADMATGFELAVSTLLGPFRRANSAFDSARFLAWVEGGKPSARKK